MSGKDAVVTTDANPRAPGPRAGPRANLKSKAGPGPPVAIKHVNSATMSEYTHGRFYL